MIVYHGTTESRARRICAEGFLPKRPSRRVWFARGHGYAMGRARTQARRAHDHPAVLTCELNLGRLRAQFGRKKVFYKNGIISIDGKLPVSVVRSYPASADQPSSPHAMAAWVNDVLGLRKHKGVGWRHSGIQRMASWAVHRYAERPNSRISDKELLSKARQWLPEYFENVVIDPDRLSVSRRYHAVTVDVDAGLEKADEREEEALGHLDRNKSEDRIKGLRLLAEMEDPDLFDWCLLCLEDPSVNLQATALHLMTQCNDVDVDSILPFVESGSKRVRGAALRVLAHHDRENTERWMRMGLSDSAPCVRVETSHGLKELDPEEHREVFLLALHDPNPDIVKRAGKLAKGKGFATWRR